MELALFSEPASAREFFSEDYSRAEAGPEVASIDSSQKFIMDYQLTELLVVTRDC